MRIKKLELSVIARYSHYLILLLLCIVMSFASDNFLSLSNITSVLRQSSLLLIMALGMMFAMLLGRGVDMSIGAIVSISSCMAAGFLQAKDSPLSIILGFVVAIGVGALAGMLNGILITYLHLPAILVTFGIREILRGIVYYYMDGGVVVNFHPVITFLGAGWVGKVPVPIIVAGLMTLLSAFVLKRTTLGRKLYVVGANPVSARFSGINVKKTAIMGFVLSGVMASIAGILYIGRLGSAEAEIGKEFAFIAVSAAAIGGVSFNGGVAKVGGVVVGAIILNLITNGMNLMNISSSWQGVINGIIIIVAVLLDYFTNRKSR